MSNHTKKGYRAVKARDPNTGRVFNAAVPIGGRIDRDQQRRLRKVQKAVREQNRMVKAAQREAKKSVPLELRAKVNWSAVKRGVQA